MRKVFDIKNLPRRKGAGIVAAFSLSLALAAAGCSTNKMPGNGEPTPTGPVYGPATGSSGVTGSSSGTHPDGHLIASGPAGMLSPQIEALTTLAEHQAYRGRVLGTATPGPNPYAGMVLPPTGQFIPPSLTANPEVTVNSSISSPPTAVVTSGADFGGSDAGVIFATAASGAPGVVGAVGTGAGVTAAQVAAPVVTTGSVGTVTSAAAGVTTVVPSTASSFAAAGLTASMNSANLAATNTGLSPAVVATSPVQFANGPGVNPAVTPSGTVVPAAPLFSTPATVASPTTAANVLTPGMFAAGPGGATALSGNTADVAGSIANPGPLPLAAGTVLGNGNTGTLTPTITSALTPSPTLAANPPVSTRNGSVVVPRATSAVTVTGTARSASLSHGVRSNAISPAATAANATAAATIAARQAAAIGSMTSSSAPVTARSARVRAARLGSNVSAPVTASATAARARAVRVVTAADGTVILTNASTAPATAGRQRSVRPQ